MLRILAVGKNLARGGNLREDAGSSTSDKGSSLYDRQKEDTETERRSVVDAPWSAPGQR